jgi:hypothetical protein
LITQPPFVPLLHTSSSTLIPCLQCTTCGFLSFPVSSFPFTSPCHSASPWPPRSHQSDNRSQSAQWAAAPPLQHRRRLLRSSAYPFWPNPAPVSLALIFSGHLPTPGHRWTPLCGRLSKIDATPWPIHLSSCPIWCDSCTFELKPGNTLPLSFQLFGLCAGLSPCFCLVVLLG